MRIAHLSDLHFFAFPSFADIWGKRLLGLANLYVGGRRRHFRTEVAEQAIQKALEACPDLVLITGDLTALASPREFALAQERLESLLKAAPTVIVPGNHDYYSWDAAREHRIEHWFGQQIHSPGWQAGEPVYPSLHLLEELAVIGLNPNRFTPGSAGHLSDDQLARLEVMLARPELQSRFVILMVHYPLLNRHGQLTQKFWRKLGNAEKLLEILRKRPVGLVLHGHDHLRYTNLLEAVGGVTVPMCNAGPAGYHRGDDYPITGSFSLYEIVHGAIQGVTCFDYHQGAFSQSYSGPMPPPPAFR